MLENSAERIEDVMVAENKQLPTLLPENLQLVSQIGYSSSCYERSLLESQHLSSRHFYHYSAK